MTLYKKFYTVKEWNGFLKTIHSGEKVGNALQFYNYFTKRLESYDYITTAEILLSKYEIILTDYMPKNRRIRGVFTIKNLDNAINKTNNIIDKISKTTNKLDGKNFKIFITEKEYRSFQHSAGKRDYSKLIGKNKKDYSFLTGKKT